MSEQKPVGIDLGTTRTGIAEILGGEPNIVENAEGDDLTPSVVQLEVDEEAVVGNEADNASAQYPDRTIREVKRKMGSDEPITVDGNEYLPEQISALILQKVVRDAEDRIGDDVSDAVITVPAYFGENERSATKSAGDIADLNVERLLPEPSAACLTYGFRKEKLGEGGEELVFVYDLGGGTFDASLVGVDYDINYFETYHTDGINTLGGKDWTGRLVDWMVEQIIEETGEDPSDQKDVMARIRDAAVEAKHTLSSKEKTSINIPFLLPDYNFEAEITRDEFNDLTSDLTERTAEPIEDLFARSDYTVDDVDTILLIGGSSRMPQVEEFVEDYFGQSVSKEVNPDKAVTYGAAIQAGILSDVESGAGMVEGETGTGSRIINVVSKSLGVRLHDGSMSHVIDSDEAVPVQERDESFTTIRDDQTKVTFPVFEGESEVAEENDKIGVVKLGESEPIPPRSPDEPSLAVEFTYDKDGTLEVEAEDLISGQSVDAVFEGVGRHSDQGVAKLQEGLPGVQK